MYLTIQTIFLRIQFLSTKWTVFRLLPVEIDFLQFDDDDDEAIRTQPGSPLDAPAQVLLSYDSD